MRKGRREKVKKTKDEEVNGQGRKKGRKGGTLTTRWVTQTLISAATETYLPTFILMA